MFFRKYLKENDLIKGMNNKKISSERDFNLAKKAASLSQGVIFDIERNGEPSYLSVQIK